MIGASRPRLMQPVRLSWLRSETADHRHWGSRGNVSTNIERVPVIIVDRYEDIARLIADAIATLIKTRQQEGKQAVLGLATGSTPVGIYRELIRMHEDEGLDFSNVVTFNLDEYYPMEPDSIHSYHRFMWENLFDHINIKRENVHIPRGDLPREQVDAYCREYEVAIRQAGGIDYQILGIGKTGHIGFNEPGSGRESRTRLVALDTITRRDAAADFFGEENVPTEAITMGVASIMNAREVALIATGEHKAAVVRRAVEGDISPDVAATYLQQHANATFYLDTAAAADLTRVKTPWVVGEVKWTPQLEMQAVIWLSEETGKSVLKLDAQDYREHHLSCTAGQLRVARSAQRRGVQCTDLEDPGPEQAAARTAHHRIFAAPGRRCHLDGRHPEQAAPERERDHRRLPDVRQHCRLRSRSAALPGVPAPLCHRLRNR